MKRESLTLGLAVLLVVMLQSQATYLVGYPDDYELGQWYYGNDPYVDVPWRLDSQDVLLGQRGWLRNLGKKIEKVGKKLSKHGG
ncbi:hypothetical protein GE061_011711 [Apolygus lucorum]|uniref:Uncharacterized protein n=1 Tax=Apolygus lucorum TaxID=248454 RepID=A0A8S9XY22_APOLU|nr:hypothetical protein GE061_011711 [Apolygus lucorum]